MATDVYPDYPDATDSDSHLVRRHFDIRASPVNGITDDADGTVLLAIGGRAEAPFAISRWEREWFPSE